MADTTLSPTGLVQIEVGASDDTWGAKLNDNAAILNGLFAWGTWTPTVSFATPGTSSFAYGTQTGRYFRVGKLVQIECVLVFTPTIGTGSGTVSINGLPIAAGSTTGPEAAVNLNNGFVWPVGTAMALAQMLTTTTLRLSAVSSNSSTGTFTTANLTGGVQHAIALTMTYQTA